MTLKHCIDPTVDYVFKKILGSKGQENVLLDFINSMLSLPVPIKQVTLLNPFNEKDFQDDKLSVVDIKAQDEQGKTIQIEIQVTSPWYLPKRMLHNWATLYHKQIESGETYRELAPVISIWLLTSSVYKQSDACHLHFEPWDPNEQVKMANQMSIHVFELDKWRKPKVFNPMDNWLYLFKSGGLFNELPTELKQVPQMRQVMSTLREISESEEDYYRYQARQEYLRIKKTEEEDRELLEKAKAELEGQNAELEGQNAELEGQNAELEKKLAQAQAKLKEAGIE